MWEHTQGSSLLWRDPRTLLGTKEGWVGRWHIAAQKDNVLLMAHSPGKGTHLCKDYVYFKKKCCLTHGISFHLGWIWLAHHFLLFPSRGEGSDLLGARAGENTQHRLAQPLPVPLGLRALLEVGGLPHAFLLSTFPDTSHTWEAISLSPAWNWVNVYEILGAVLRPTWLWNQTLEER